MPPLTRREKRGGGLATRRRPSFHPASPPLGAPTGLPAGIDVLRGGPPRALHTAPRPRARRRLRPSSAPATALQGRRAPTPGAGIALGLRSHWRALGIRRSIRRVPPIPTPVADRWASSPAPPQAGRVQQRRLAADTQGMRRKAAAPGEQGAGAWFRSPRCGLSTIRILPRLRSEAQCRRTGMRQRWGSWLGGGRVPTDPRRGRRAAGGSDRRRDAETAAERGNPAYPRNIFQEGRFGRTGSPVACRGRTAPGRLQDGGAAGRSNLDTGWCGGHGQCRSG